MTTKPLKDEYEDLVPNNFNVESRLIVITNELKEDNPHVKAVLTRVNKVEVEIPRPELLQILGQIIKKPDMYGLKLHERQEVLDYLTEKTTNQTEDLNIRTLLRMFQLRSLSNDVPQYSWKTLSLKLLNKDTNLALVEQILADDSFTSEDERIEKFAEKTGGSRATYFRLKKKIEAMKRIAKKSSESGNPKKNIVTEFDREPEHDGQQDANPDDDVVNQEDVD
jgi:hypothetical protein